MGGPSATGNVCGEKVTCTMGASGMGLCYQQTSMARPQASGSEPHLGNSSRSVLQIGLMVEAVCRDQR